MMVWGPQTSGTPKSEIGLFGFFLSRNFDALPGPGLGSAASYQATCILLETLGWMGQTHSKAMKSHAVGIIRCSSVAHGCSSRDNTVVV